MSKKSFTIRRIEKKDAANILLKFHYLKDISKGFKSGYNYGLFKKTTIKFFDGETESEELVGVCIYTGFPVPELSKGMLGLSRNDQDGLFELSRLCLEPVTQANEHNLASWFVSRTLRQLRKDTNVRVVLSYADDDFHSGVVYAASNFKYYGLTTKKSDFWIENEDGTFTKHSRGSVKSLKGEWRPRSRKHRFVMKYDKQLKILWDEEKYISRAV